ncbi:MAG: hypothetical protein ACLTMP_06175 [Eggerthella lenta]
MLDGVSSEAIVVHRERCAKVRNRNVACLKCADACTSGCRYGRRAGGASASDAARARPCTPRARNPATRSLRRRA